VKTFENRLPVRPRKKWDTIEKFVEGKSVLEIGCGTGYAPISYRSPFSICHKIPLNLKMAS